MWLAGDKSPSAASGVSVECACSLLKRSYVATKNGARFFNGKMPKTQPCHTKGRERNDNHLLGVWFSPVGDSGMVASPGSWLTRLVMAAASEAHAADDEVSSEQDGKSVSVTSTVAPDRISVSG